MPRIARRIEEDIIATSRDARHRLADGVSTLSAPVLDTTTAASPRSRAPRQGGGGFRARPERLLLVCWYDPNGISTVPETVAFIQEFSRFPITVLNMFEHKVGSGHLQLSPDVDLDAFAGVIFHNTVTYNAGNMRCMDLHTRRKLKDFPGVKVLMKQDDNHEFRGIAEHIADTGYDILLTCLPPEGVSRLYPPDVLGRARVERMLTGYVTPTLRAIDFRNGARPVDIGYRGSIQPLSFGRLAYDKRDIGVAVARRLADADLTLDISSRWEDRFGGESWYQFLLSCKATLGTESGASIFDLDGTLAERIGAIERELGPLRDDADYAEAYLARLTDLEDRIDHRQISPRHFEAAACGTLQLLHPGRYSGILVPDRHFVPLATDGSDLERAVSLLRDERRRAEIVETAYEEVILNRAYWIETFVLRLDDLVEEAGREKGALVESKAPGPGTGRHVLVLISSEARHDPRSDWISDHAPPSLLVHRLGIGNPDQAPVLETSPRGALAWGVPRCAWTEGQAFLWSQTLGTSPAATAALRELMLIEAMTKLSAEERAEAMGVARDSPRQRRLDLYLRDLLAVTATLVQAAYNLRGVQAIVACDLYTLPAAVILKGLFEAEILYDARECMPLVIPESQRFERDLFSGLERRLLTHTAARQTVSPGLADLMGAEYGLAFDVVSNARPRGSDVPAPARGLEQCVFFVRGSFGPSSGIEPLIKAWHRTPAAAILHLQAVDDDDKRRMLAAANATGLLGTRILLLDQATNESGGFLTMIDVGLIPNAPAQPNDRFGCPLELSEYMSAGMPVLSTETRFVAGVIHAASCGRAVDFEDEDRLIEAIEEMVASADLRAELGFNGAEYSRTTFNWQVQSSVLYDRLGAILHDCEPMELIVVDWPHPIAAQSHDTNGAASDHGPPRQDEVPPPGGFDAADEVVPCRSPSVRLLGRLIWPWRR